MATAATNSRGSSVGDPVRNFRFLVKFNRMTDAGARAGAWYPKLTVGFSSVDGLAVLIDTLPIREGGYNATVHNIPLQISHNPVTFQRGVVLGSSQHWDWMRSMYKAVQGTAGAGAIFRSDIEISVLAHPLTVNSEGLNTVGGFGARYEGFAAQNDPVAARFMLYNAFPTQLIFSSLNAMDNALFVESMTVAHEGLDMRWSTASEDLSAWTSAPEFSA